MPSDPNDSDEALVAQISEIAKRGKGSGSENFHAGNLLDALDHFAKLLFRLSRNAEKQSKRIVGLTWALLLFTAALFIAQWVERNSNDDSRYEIRTYSGYPTRIDKKTGEAVILRPRRSSDFSNMPTSSPTWSGKPWEATPPH